MACKAAWNDRPREVGVGVTIVARRQIPRLALRVVSDRRHVGVSIVDEQIAASCRPRSHIIRHRLFTLEHAVPAGELEANRASACRHPIAETGGCLIEVCVIEGLERVAAGPSTAGSHGSPLVAVDDRAMTSGAFPADLGKGGARQGGGEQKTAHEIQIHFPLAVSSSLGSNFLPARIVSNTSLERVFQAPCFCGVRLLWSDSTMGMISFGPGT